MTRSRKFRCGFRLVAASQRPLLCLLLLAVPASAMAQAGFQIIAHPDSGVSSLTQAEASQIFLRKSPSLPSGTPALPVDQAVGSEVREAFSKAVHGRGATQIQRYWQQQLFSGSAVPPAEMAGDSEVLAYVQANPGAIGYVSTRGSTAGVSVVRLATATAEGAQAAEEFRHLDPDMTPPRLLETVDPEYPLVARRARYECAMTVRAKIDASGQVRDVEVVEPCDRFAKQLSESALRAIRQWTFEPALDPQGQKISVAYTFQVWFTL